MPDISVSLSAVQSYRKCPQQYAYAYYEELKPKIASAPMDLGSVLHDYLENYYTLLQSKHSPEKAHSNAITLTRSKYGPYLQGMANTAKIMGSYDVAADFSEMLPKALHIAERYFITHGEADAERYEILLVERRLRAKINKDPVILSNGKADMLTRDRLSGQVLMWEHKSTTSVPSHGHRLRDLQTVLYVAKLRLLHYQCTGIHWNYLRTKEPKVPEVNKSGKTMQRNIGDTTWETYRAAVIAAGFNPADYADMEDKLRSNEQNIFFPRFEYTINTGGEAILLDDYIRTSRRIAADRAAWDAGERPERNPNRDCDYHCDFSRLCNAVLTGQDDTLLRQMWFTTPAEREAEYGNTP